MIENRALCCYHGSVKPPASPPDCFRCAYFRVTWDEKFPRACLMFNIKSRELPSLVVLRNTGCNCPAFRESDKLRKGREKPES